MDSKHNNYWDRKNWVPLENRVTLPEIDWSETLGRLPREVHHIPVPMDELMGRPPFGMVALAKKSTKGWKVTVINHPLGLLTDVGSQTLLSETRKWISNLLNTYLADLKEHPLARTSMTREVTPTHHLRVARRGPTNWPDLKLATPDLFESPFFHQNKEGTEGIGITIGQGDMGWSRPPSRHSTPEFHNFLGTIPMDELLELLQEVGDFCLNKRFRGMVLYHSKHLDLTCEVYEQDLPKVILEVRQRYALMKETNEDSTSR